MVTAQLIKRFARDKKHKRELILLFAGAGGVLVVVGIVLSHEKVFEYGTLWLFEQFIGGVKRSFFGGLE